MFTASTCEAGAIAWIRMLLGECAYTPQEEWSVILGYSSIAFWLLAQFPQLIENAKRGNSDSLSLIFLCNWLSGDFANLIGCVFTQQLPFQTYLALYFVFIDTSLFVQSLYFRLKKEASEDTNQDQDEQTPLLPPIARGASSILSMVGFFISSTAYSVPGTGMEDVEVLLGALETPSNPDASYQLGRLFAWICCILYLSSRIPQIYRNFERRSCEGLAMSMFGCALLGNLTYSLSILVKSVEPAYIYNALPYLLGSGGTVVFDFVIFTQYIVWRGGEKQNLASTLDP